MAVLPVVRLPEAVLSRRAVEVERLADVQDLARDLVETMRASPACVGLAATQVGASVRVFCVDVTGHRKAESCHGLIVLCNPELVAASAPVMAREGCMSVPDLTGDVSRASDVVIRGLTLDGAEQVIHADAFEARALLHELDHLDGVLFLDRVVAHDRVFRRRVYR